MYLARLIVATHIGRKHANLGLERYGVFHLGARTANQVIVIVKDDNARILVEPIGIRNQSGIRIHEGRIVGGIPRSIVSIVKSEMRAVTTEHSSGNRYRLDKRPFHVTRVGALGMNRRESLHIVRPVAFDSGSRSILATEIVADGESVQGFVGHVTQADSRTERGCFRVSLVTQVRLNLASRIGRHDPSYLVRGTYTPGNHRGRNVGGRESSSANLDTGRDLQHKRMRTRRKMDGHVRNCHRTPGIGNGRRPSQHA